MQHMVHNRKVFIDDKHILIFSMLINLRLDNVSRGEAVMLASNYWAEKLSKIQVKSKLGLTDIYTHSWDASWRDLTVDSSLT